MADDTTRGFHKVYLLPAAQFKYIFFSRCASVLSYVNRIGKTGIFARYQNAAW